MPRIDVTVSSSSPGWPTPTASTATMADIEQARFAGNDPRRPSYAEAKNRWPTPNATDYKGASTRSEGKERSASDDDLPTRLTRMAKSWPTPTASDSERTGGRGANAEGGQGLQEATTLWPTPVAMYSTRGAVNTPPKPGQTVSLSHATAARLWPTATAGDAKASGSRNTSDSKAHPGVILIDAVRGDGGSGRLWVTPRADGFDAGGHRGSTDSLHSQVKVTEADEGEARTTEALNPAWVEILMNFPPGWTDVPTPRRSDGPLAPTKSSTRSNRRARSAAPPAEEDIPQSPMNSATEEPVSVLSGTQSSPPSPKSSDGG
ncbi:MAG: hypothetical protein ACHREM_00605 [Polyangiales bacterium]